MSNVNIIILSLTAGAATFLGVFLGSSGRHSSKTIALGSSFAAVIMLLISAVELIPASIFEGGLVKSGLFVAAGAFVIAIANYYIPHLHTFHDIKNCDNKCLIKASYLIAIGLVLHDFPEGFAIPASFTSSSSLGTAVIISSFLHNIPEGYAMTVASHGIKGGFGYKSATYSTFASLSGSILGILLIDCFESINFIFLAVAAGAMLYIAFHELMPLAVKYKEKTAMLWGGALAVAVFLFLNLL